MPEKAVEDSAKLKEERTSYILIFDSSVFFIISLTLISILLYYYIRLFTPIPHFFRLITYIPLFFLLCYSDTTIMPKCGTGVREQRLLLSLLGPL